MKCLNTGVISYVGWVWSSAGELSPEYDYCWQLLTSFDNLCSSLLQSQNFQYWCRPLGWGPKRLDWNRKLRMKSLSRIAPGVWSRLSQEIVLKKQLLCVVKTGSLVISSPFYLLFSSHLARFKCNIPPRSFSHKPKQTRFIYNIPRCEMTWGRDDQWE